MSSKSLTNWNTRARQSSGRRGLVWMVALLVPLGLIAAVVIAPIVYHHGIVVTTLVLLAVPVILVTLVIGFRRGLSLFQKLTEHLQWWHILWMLIFASALVFRVRGVNQIEQNPLDAWALYRIGLEMIVATALFIRLALRRTPWFGSMFRGLLGAITAFGVVELVSTAWSVYPAWTFYKSCEYLLDIALLAAVLATIHSVKDYKHFYNWTWTLYGMLLLSAWLGVLLWPQVALHPHGMNIGMLGIRLRGVLPAVSANDVGTFSGILALISLCRLLPIEGKNSDRTWYLLLFSASMATMVLSQTRTAIAGFFFGVFLLLYFSKRLGRSVLLTFVVAPLLIASSVGGLVWSYLVRGQSAQQLDTLSSRVQWWSFAWEKFLERPLVGYGAYAAGRFAVLAKHGLTKTSTMHSDYLSIIVGTSIWGLIPFLTALLGTWWFLVQYLRHSTAMSADQQVAYEALAVLSLLTFRSVFMTMLTWHPPLDYLIVLGYAEFLRRRRLREIPVAVHVIRERQPELVATSAGR